MKFCLNPAYSFKNRISFVIILINKNETRSVDDIFFVNENVATTYCCTTGHIRTPPRNVLDTPEQAFFSPEENTD